MPAIKRKFKDYKFPEPKLNSIEFNHNYIENIDFLNHTAMARQCELFEAPAVQPWPWYGELAFHGGLPPATFSYNRKFFQFFG